MIQNILNRINYAEFIILFVLCLIFYSALNYYADVALEGTKTIILVRRVLLLRLIFSVTFALLLGFIGVKISGHVWPATLVHAVVVTGMLLFDLSLNELRADWMLIVLIVGTVASITALGGGLTLAYYWLRTRR